MLLRLAIILFGVLAIVAQVVFLREFLVVAGGNEIFIGVIFFSWFLGITLGAWLLSLLSSRIRTPLPAAIMLLSLQTLLFPTSCFLIRLLRLLLQIPIGELVPFFSFLFYCLVTVIPFSIITGLVFPLFCMHWRQQERIPGAAIGRVYYLESFGSIIGGLAFSFFLVLWLTSFQLAFLLGALINLNLVFLSFQLSKKWQTSALSLLLLLLFGAGYLLGGVRYLENSSRQLRWQAIGGEIQLLKELNTKYQHLALSYASEQYSLLSNGHFIAAFPDDYQSSLLANLMMTQTKEPRRILLLGAGSPELIYYLLFWKPEQIDYVELDKRVLPFIEDSLRPEITAALASESVHTHYMDARHFVRQQLRTTIPPHQRYDLIIINMPEPNTAALNRFYTLEFFHDLRQLLKPDAVVTTSLSSAVNYFGPVVINYFGSVYKTLQRFFPHIAICPGTQAYVFASPQPGVVTEDVSTLMQRYRSLDTEIPYFSEQIFYTLYQQSQIELVRRSLTQSLPRLPLNTDLNPITYYYNLMLWWHFSGSGTRSLLSLINLIKLRPLLVLLAILFFFRLLYLRLRQPLPERIYFFNALLLIASTGFLAMASEIIILYLFQNIFGYIYQKVGIVVALFMAGLMSGSWLLTQLLPQTLAAVRRIIITFESLILLLLLSLALFIPQLIKGTLPWHLTELSFYLLTFLFGLLAGGEFPLAGRVCLLCRQDLGKAAGLVDSADHLGAMLGALLTGVFLVPALGIINSLLLILALKFLILALFLLPNPLRLSTRK